MTRNSAIDATKIGANMRAAREAKGISRAELARKVNMYPSLIRCYEKMEVCPGTDKLILLANALGIGLDEYVAGIVTRIQPNEWVSVKERLPCPWEEILIFLEPYVDIGYLLETGDFNSIRGFNNITHWMPLPAPPEKEK